MVVSDLRSDLWKTVFDASVVSLFLVNILQVADGNIPAKGEVRTAHSNESDE